MMKIIGKFAAIAALLILVASTTNAQTALDYMESIGKEFKKVSEETWDYTRTVAHNKNAKRVEATRKDMLNANRTALNKIKKMRPFNGDAAYRDSIAKYFELSYMVINNDYSKIVDMEEIAEQSYDAMEAYMMAQQIANDKLQAASEVAENAEREFAKNNNINLIESTSKTADKLDKASEVFKSYNEVYLIFFKPFKQEAYMIDAMNRSDINAMKQNQESLSKLSKEALEKLKVAKPYKNNNSLIVACKKLMDFYITEADTKGPELVDYFLTKEKFDKLKSMMDKKGKNHSQSDVDEYNAAVNEFNKANNNFNSINNELNNKRQNILGDWNKAVSKFLDRNISKKK